MLEAICVVMFLVGGTALLAILSQSKRSVLDEGIADLKAGRVTKVKPKKAAAKKRGKK